MTDGDITRLNRMYKCPDFEEKQVEIFKETTTQASVTKKIKGDVDIPVNGETKTQEATTNETKSKPVIPQNEDGMEKNHGKRRNIDSDSPLANLFRNLTKRLARLIRPLFGLIRKLIPALNLSN